MLPFDCKEYSISQLLSMNDSKCCIGLFQQEGLFVKEEWIIRISKNENGVYERFDYNLKTKELKMSKKEKTGSEFISVANTVVESNCVIDVSNDGWRWEGSCLNHSPFGYGSLYNSYNELIYQGVMIGDKKECFGVEFYPDRSQIEYVGCYWENDKHGFGVLYDRTGELLYEGVFICGSSYFETSVILKDIDDDRMVHSLIHELVIDEGYGNMFQGDLLLCGFDFLEKLVVKKKSFHNVTSLKISDNGVLNSIEIEDSEFDDDCCFDFNNSFCNVKSVTITSALIDG